MLDLRTVKNSWHALKKRNQKQNKPDGLVNRHSSSSNKYSVFPTREKWSVS